MADLVAGKTRTSERTSLLEPPTQSIPAIMSGISAQTGVQVREQTMIRETKPDAADVVIIGGGPGGYVGAIRAAQLGGRVILIEKADLGGVCLNRGCIPTKVMLSSADAYDLIARRSKEFGVTVGGEVSYDYGVMLARRDKVVKQLVSGVGFLMKKHNVQVVKGTGKLTAGDTVVVTLADGKQETVHGRNVVIATGSEPVPLPIEGLEGENIWDSDGALNAREVPKSLLIIGGGAIGVEWSYLFRKLGAEVTIVELMSQILPLTDTEVAVDLRKILEKSGIRILTECRVNKVEHKNGAETATVACGENEQQITADKILVAVGRRPVSNDLGLEELKIATERGKILVNERMQTNVPEVYAIGDVVGGMLLAHKASEEGVVAAENCMGRDTKMSYRSIVSAVYTTPEVATVGITEDTAKKQGMDVKVGKVPFRINGKALGLGEREGFVKFVADARYGEILGCHIIGPHATDLIHEVVIGMDAEATIEVIGKAVHAHPTLAEVVHEAAQDVDGGSIHKG